MKAFAELFAELDQTTRTTCKVEALAAYLGRVDDVDQLWAIALLSGRTPRRAVTTRQLRQWAAAVAGIPDWLFDESYAIVGDLAETIALLLPGDRQRDNRPLALWMSDIGRLAAGDDEGKRAFVTSAWERLGRTERLVFNKLITGGFRVGVSQKLMTRAIALATGLEDAAIAERIMGDWSPATTTFRALFIDSGGHHVVSRPYPFFLAHPLDDAIAAIGAPADWLAERKWDGIRGQLIRRDGRTFVWSRGEELVTNRFPELSELGDVLPDGTVIDGEILPWRDGRPLRFQALQTRIGRKTVTRKALVEAPVVLMAYDLIEWQGEDIRALALRKRRAMLEALVAETRQCPALVLSPLVAFSDWETLAAERDRSREFLSEGLMLKRAQSAYGIGRRKGDWWKWKIAPETIDAVMIYAQAGHGRRANLYSDFTFAVWGAGGELVPFAKAYSGLTDAELQEITAWVRRNTLERFGPVRRVTPHHVFEIAFEGLQPSTRHKSGVAVRFPRISRWRRDKPISEANSLDDLMALLAPRKY